MQPFLFRASSSLTRPSCGGFTSTIAVSYSYRALSDRADECLLKNKFGEFYKRFYSAVSGDAGPMKKGAGGGEGNGAIGNKSSESEHQVTPTRLPPDKLRSVRKPSFISKEAILKIEKSTTQLTSRFLEHDRLSRELRAKIKQLSTQRRQIHKNEDEAVRRNPESEQEIEDIKKSLEDEMALLDKTLVYISTHYYDLPPESEPEPVSAADISLDPSKRSQNPIFTPYMSPFPNYSTSPYNSTLNQSLLRLLGTRPPPPALIARICYNLLNSPHPPNVQTYNILIERLTRVRNGSLAHIVFRNMLEGGLGPGGKPNEDTVVRMINLCVKTADREGFERIAKITSERNMARWWGFGKNRTAKTREQKRRGKLTLEALIHGAARFGKAQQVRVYTRAMSRECPDDPKPSIPLYTSIMRMWREMKEWDRGLRCWRDIMRRDREWNRHGLGMPADIRAFREMLRLCRVCNKEEIRNGIIRLALERGFEESELLGRLDKTKGLWVRNTNKTPHIRGMRRETKRDDVEILGSLEEGWEDLEPVKKLDAHSASSRSSDRVNSRVWHDILSRRMREVRDDRFVGRNLKDQLKEHHRKREERRKALKERSFQDQHDSSSKAGLEG
ncbi:hypothetical protein P167DRAFT_493070 [Morchella conica CCBAS932]|uniref:Uncharacterized protein n=1 Tax=Morchella conica CCBAS932 TaxID=1392247 RepID=A0A3N4KIF0_9PEZI|nr:hypothetical protein P167DRAFT_493070 [Morchella conica CCBAS932]